MVRGGKTYRIVTDQVGSPRAVVDTRTGAVAAGARLRRVRPRHARHATRASSRSASPAACYDRDTGLVRFGARDYDPETGRFTTPRTRCGFGGGDTNLYGYALADPVNLADPTGQILDTILDIGFIVYDLYQIGKSLMNGCGVSGMNAAASGPTWPR